MIFFMKKRNFIFWLVFAAASLQAVTNVSIVTFNTDKLCGEVGDSQYHSIGRILSCLDADVFMLQEIPISTVENLVSLRDDYLTNYYVVWSGNHDNFNRQAVLSRYPIVAKGDVVTNDPSLPANFTRELLWGKIEVPDTDCINVFSAHLKAGFTGGDVYLREIEARKITNYLAQFIMENPLAQIVLAGDMNTDVEDPLDGDAVNILTNSAAQTRYTDAFNPTTGLDDTLTSGSRFDYQFPNPRLVDTTSLVFRTDAGTPPPCVFVSDTTNASDHYPVFFNYALGPAQNTNFAKILVTEIDVWRSDNANEFIELYNAGNITQNLQGWAIDDLEGDSQIIAASPAILHPGHYALVKYDETGIPDSTSEGDGVLNLFLSNSLSFTATDDQFVLLDKSDFFVDGVIWNNNDYTLAPGNGSDFNEMCKYSWIYPLVMDNNPTQYIERSVEVRGTTSPSGQSLFRWRNENLNYLETDKKEDWATSSVGTPGAPNTIYFPKPNILFTEVAVWQTPSAATQDFVEIYNEGNTTVDISGFVITDFDGSDTNILSETNAWLLPGDYALLFLDDGSNDVTSADDGVLNIYNVDKNLKTVTKSEGLILSDSLGRALDAVVYFSDNGATGTANEISDLAELCPDDWDYDPDPTTWPMYFAYAVSASPDGGTNSPGSNDSISRYLFDDIADDYLDRDLKLDWYVSAQDITPGAPSKESIIPEPIEIWIVGVLGCWIIVKLKRPNFKF